MSLFSAALESVIRGRNWNQTAAASAFAISVGAASNYLSGRRPAPEQLAQICAALEDHERASLLEAHLRDELPKAYRELVAITQTGESPAMREEALSAWQTADLPPSTRAALDLIANKARADEIVRDWIEASAAMLRD
jgi:transcriptional regulator with XRE-family HTH domain